MPNKSYRKGYRKENKIQNQLKDEGWDVAQRTAGSHSCVDVFAIRKLDNKILLVQAKPNDLSDSARDKLLKENDWLNGKFDVEFVVL